MKKIQKPKDERSHESGPSDIYYEPISKPLLFAGKSKSPELLLEKEKDSNLNRRRNISGRRM